MDVNIPQSYLYMLNNIAKKIIKKYLNSNMLFSDFVAKQISSKYNVLHRKSLPKTGGNRQGTMIDRHSFNLAGTKFQDKIKINDSKLLEKIPSVAGYIPFLKNNTNIVLYNFFSKNYGIRKQLLTRLSLCKGKDLIDTKWILLQSNCVKRLLLKEWQSLDADYISVEVFNPKLPKNHGSHDGVFNFWGLFGDGAATVHSMPNPNFTFPPQYLKVHRRYVPAVSNLQNNTVFASFSSLHGKKVVEDKKALLDVENLMSPVGYISLSEKTNVETVKSIWHERVLEQNPLPRIFSLQIISFPPDLQLDAVLIFTEAINKQETIILHFFNVDDKIIDKNEIVITPKSQIQISKIFDLKKHKLSYVAIEFTNLNNSSICGHINFTYIVNGFVADSVHAHPVSGSDKIIRRNKINKMGFFGNQCMKFMHFLPLNKADSYISIWGEKDTKNAKLRFMFENGSEFVYNFKLKAIKLSHIQINKFSLSELFPSNEHGIVQLECFSGNPHANLTSKVYGKNSVSVDHFTGG